MKTDKIEKDKFVAFAYKVTDPEGNLLFEAPEQAPDTIVYGRTEGMVPGLAAALDGLKAGDKFEVTLPPEAAFGDRDDSLIFKLGPEVFSADGKLPANVKVGAMLPMMTDTGQKVYGMVTDVAPDQVTMDFNHPLAGKTVTYKGQVLEVRPATEEELNPPTGCCGGCGGGCSDSSCSGCDGGCN